MSINKKLFSGFAGVLALLVLIAGISLYQLTSITNQYSFLIGEQVKKVTSAKELKYLVTKEMRDVRGFLISGNEDHIEIYKTAVAAYDKEETYLKSVLVAPEAQQLLDELNKLHSDYAEVAEQVFTYKKAGNTEGYVKLLAERGTPIGNEFAAKAGELEKMCLDVLKTESEKAAHQAANLKITILIFSILAIILGLALAFYISRIIAGPVGKVAEAAKQIADGDLSFADIQVKNKDEIGDMADSFNVMKQNLREVIREVNESSEQIAASSEQLTAGAEQTGNATEQITVSIQEVANGAESQTVSVEESAKALEEVTQGIQHMAENSSSIAESGAQLSEKAKQGGEYVEQTVQQMESIHQSVDVSDEVMKLLDNRSQEIGEITQVITSIADQTNLLALNAAIEAARAGEHGKGFAVVADEVRKLAEQSQQSSTQISQLIKEIQADMVRSTDSIGQVKADVQKGLGIVENTQSTFNEILHSMDSISTQIHEMAATAQQMSAGAEEVSATVEGISSISKQTSMHSQGVAASTEEQLASMEEITTSANELSKMAANLQEVMGKFKI
ncbi:methyl-accepting chemotaxis protein [Domibacillus tundrae]|uniref:methyl-accepting chemotaxis protein n=1 Tax=Domibacillus tundrae TaxID=1587527 RepID=UPI0006967858|nr:methyl-accepting chemotaxis protein [Domibacillus tundrae]